MAGAVSGLITFGTQNGPIATGNLDTNFTAFQTAVNSANSYSNYLVDSGSANTIAVTVASPAAATLSAGLTLTIKVAQTNTGATTLNLNGGGAVAVVDPLGAPLASNDLNAGGIFTFVYNGTYWQVLGALASGSTGVAFADTFTATAGQTVFTLSNNPGNINNLGVSLDGSVLVASIDYTWTSPKTLTLTAGAKAGQTLFVRYIENYTIGTPIAAGTNNQIQYNNSGVLNGTTIGGDATLVATTGALTVTKTAGVAFAASATTDTTNAANISSGILPVARQSYTQGGTGSVARTVTNKLQESVSVLDFGADPTGVADSTTAIQAAINSCNNILIPPGIYKCSAALTINKNSTTIRGTRGASILQFVTAGSDGIVFTGAPNLQLIVLEGVVIQSATATGGKALNIAFLTDGQINHVIRDVKFGYSGAGRWAYGLFADNFQSSEIYSLNYYGGVTVGIHLENACNALRFYGVELVGDSLAERGIEIISGYNDAWFFSGTIQAYFSKSCIYVNGTEGAFVTTAYPRFYGFHLENLTVSPTDGADVSVNNAANVTFHGFQGGSFDIGATLALNISLVSCAVGNVSIHPGAKNTSIFGCMAYITDNGSTTTLLGTFTPNGYPTVSTLPLVGPYQLGRISFSPGAGSGNGPTNSVTWTYQAPVAGAWIRGDIAWNFNAAAGGIPGWMCVASGTPGTWKAMANLAA